MLEIDDFLDAVRRVGKGGTAIDPEVISQLLGREREDEPARRAVAARARGARAHGPGVSNKGICERLMVSPKTVETHVNSMFWKLNLLPAQDEDRRVLVLAYIRS